MKFLPGAFRGLLIAAVASVAGDSLCDEPSQTAEAIDAQLAAGEFATAIEGAWMLPDGAARDGALGRIAAAQQAAGAGSAALETLRQVSSDAVRHGALSSYLGGPPPASGGAGGGTQADFDALIELIASTVHPDSWDENGGPGSIREFAGGVYVDTEGVLRAVTVDGDGQLLRLRRVQPRTEAYFADAQAHTKSPLRYVSLSRLEREILLRRTAGEPLDPAMQVFAGLQRVRFVFIYPKSREIVLAGPAGPWSADADGRAVAIETGQPLVHLEDFITLWRRLWQHGPGKFGCSITPKRKNLEQAQAYLTETGKRPLKPGQRKRWLDGLRESVGRQTIEVFGLDPQTRAARVIVEADYRMKLVGMGLEDGVPGVTSYLDTIRVRPGESPPPMDVLRWWFTLNYGAIRTTRERDAFEIRGPGVKVLSENEMLTERGERIHTGRSDALNQQFATSFTAHFDKLAAKYPIYTDLRNIFDLAIVVGLIRSEGLADRVGWSGEAFRDETVYTITSGPPPKEVETVVNHRVIGRKHIIAGVSGGVSIDARPAVAQESIETDPYGPAREAHVAVPDKLRRTAWWWD